MEVKYEMIIRLFESMLRNWKRLEMKKEFGDGDVIAWILSTHIQVSKLIS